uniref:(northern house mosquito) hypothetical protein n=1 Tax=Culex pipiens TaxID=7175 RepID=A0A8D8G6R3_CULPI
MAAAFCAISATRCSCPAWPSISTSLPRITSENTNAASVTDGLARLTVSSATCRLTRPTAKSSAVPSVRRRSRGKRPWRSTCGTMKKIVRTCAWSVAVDTPIGRCSPNTFR